MPIVTLAVNLASDQDMINVVNAVQMAIEAHLYLIWFQIQELVNDLLEVMNLMEDVLKDESTGFMEESKISDMNTALKTRSRK